MARITISYRRDDSMDITGRIFDRLSSHYGREAIFRDIDNIPPGIDFRQHIRASINESDVLMVVVGPRWLGDDQHGRPRIHSESDFVRVEVEAALDRRIPVIPLLVGDAKMPEPDRLPVSLRDFAYRNAVEIDSGRDFDHHMNGLIRATDKIVLAAAPADTPGTPPPKPAPAGPAPQSNFLPMVGGVMTVLGLMHAGWFTSNLLTSWANGALPQMFGQVWTYADMSFGFGGLAIGVGTLRGASWARAAGLILCLLAASSNFLWLIDSYDKPLPRLMLIGTSLTLLLAVVGAYLLLFRWPPSPESKN